MRRLLLLPLLLTGCITRGSGVPAPAGALQCAEAAAANLGYQVVSRTSQYSFLAEKQFPGANLYPVIGELSAAFWGDRSGRHWLSVDGSRYEVFDGRPRVIPTGGRSPGDGQVIRVGSGRGARRRLSPGPVAEDARAIEQLCAADGTAAPIERPPATAGPAAGGGS